MQTSPFKKNELKYNKTPVINRRQSPDKQLSPLKMSPPIKKNVGFSKFIMKDNQKTVASPFSKTFSPEKRKQVTDYSSNTSRFDKRTSFLKKNVKDSIVDVPKSLAGKKLV